MQDRQRGGAFRVGGYVAFALLATLVLAGPSACRVLEPRPTLPAVNATPVTYDDDDAYVTYTFPPERTVCTFADTLCYTQI